MPDRPKTTVDVSWNGKFQFTSRDGFGHTVKVDAPMEEGDGFDGFKPGELLLTSLAACSGIDVVNILQRERQQVTGLEIRVKGTQLPDPPWTWVEFELEYLVRGRGLRESAVKRAVHLSETKYCSVGATIAGRATVKSSFKILEQETDST